MNKLKELAIAYEFSLCHGFCPDAEEANDLWNETPYTPMSFDIGFLDNYQGNSSSELVSEIIREINKL